MARKVIKILLVLDLIVSIVIIFKVNSSLLENQVAYIEQRGILGMVIAILLTAFGGIAYCGYSYELRCYKNKKKKMINNSIGTNN